MYKITYCTTNNHTGTQLGQECKYLKTNDPAVAVVATMENFRYSSFDPEGEDLDFSDLITQVLKNSKTIDTLVEPDSYVRQDSKHSFSAIKLTLVPDRHDLKKDQLIKISFAAAVANVDTILNMSISTPDI